jgi:hypothetical protein
MSIFNIWSSERVCRTRMISRDFFECKVKRFNPSFCEYSLIMGDGFICKHPNRIVFSNKK